jgi:hypothetical protein
MERGGYRQKSWSVIRCFLLRDGFVRATAACTPPGPGVMKRELLPRIVVNGSAVSVARRLCDDGGRMHNPPWPPLLKGGKVKRNKRRGKAAPRGLPIFITRGTGRGPFLRGGKGRGLFRRCGGMDAQQTPREGGASRIAHFQLPEQRRRSAVDGSISPQRTEKYLQRICGTIDNIHQKTADRISCVRFNIRHL